MKTTFWAIGDMHLSFAKPRDFTQFGEKWHDHADRIAVHWRQCVQPHDVVLMLGDTSWANSVSRVRPDFEWLAALPGRKIMVRGNHDRWWSNIKKVRRNILPEGFYALQGDCMEVEGVLLCGAQGHIAPDDPFYRPDPPHNRYQRELDTLQMAVDAVKQARQPGQPLIILLHYQPFTSDARPTAYSALVEELAPAMCLYGHLHRSSEWEAAINGQRAGIDYRLLSADFVDMMLQEVWTINDA
jgi:predicted phosphohydrolase